MLGILLGFLGIATSFIPFFEKLLNTDRDNGRYVFQHQQATSNAGESLTVFDSRTGVLFTAVKFEDEHGNDGLSWVEIHPNTGITIMRRLNRQIEPIPKIPSTHK